MSDFKISIKEVPEKEIPKYISDMDKATREWTSRAARGECGWVCSDCGMSDPAGMPDACFHKIERCTEIIMRDRMRAMGEHRGQGS